MKDIIELIVGGIYEVKCSLAGCSTGWDGTFKVVELRSETFLVEVISGLDLLPLEDGLGHVGYHTTFHNLMSFISIPQEQLDFNFTFNDLITR